MKGASSLASMLVIDPKRRGAPNGCSIATIRGLVDGSIGFSGSAATGLIQTPNALYGPPTDGRKYGGSYLAIMTGE